MSGARILFVDAYDSFSASIVALLQQISHSQVVIVKIDTNIRALYGLSVESFLSHFDAVVLGPGPGQPDRREDVGLFSEIWQVAEKKQIPVLGICLGFQHLCQRYGIQVDRMPLPCHGHAKRVIHQRHDIFHDAGQVFATQYNSLGVSIGHWTKVSHMSRILCAENLDSSPESSRPPSVISSVGDFEPELDPTTPVNSLKLLAWNEDGYAMAVRHTSNPFWGIQFHPESCKSSASCHRILQNWFIEARRTEYRRASHLELPTQKTSSSTTLKSIPSLKLAQDMCVLMPESDRYVSSCTVALKGSNESVRDFCYLLTNTFDVIMLESTRKGRYSVYGISDVTTLRMELSNTTCRLTQAGSSIADYSISSTDALSVIEKILLEKRVLEGPWDLPFWGGLVGFFSYECGLNFVGATTENKTPNSAATPDISLVWIDRSIIFDHETSEVTIQSVRAGDKEWLDQTALGLNLRRDEQQEPGVSDLLAKVEYQLPQKDEYVAKVLACQAELMAGNSYELCLTTESRVKTPIDKNNSFQLYKSIQSQNPVPYAAFLRIGDMTVLCSSPEKFLSWSRRGVLDMIPMKGTVKKSTGVTIEMAETILSTPKETAENLMIADLIRHDLYNVVGCENAQVQVIQLCEVVEHETVYQLVSHIRASRPPNGTSDDEGCSEAIRTGCRALTCTLPPGSMTGAPKKRSCEILSGLEARERGVYSGIIGYFDLGGGGAWNVCIRSAFSHAAEDEDVMQTWHIGAGGAVTVLSEPESEWEEMQTKLNSVLRGFGHL